MKTVLIVDDEKEIIDNLKFDIRDLQLKVISAKNGMEAISVMENHPIDLILTDINMPQLDGISWVKKIKRNGFRTPVVFLSGHWDSHFLAINDHETQDVIFNSQRIMKKPYEVNEIREVVSNLLTLE